jgi:eukaryotic-like serine/threonine-protein kinase
VQPVGTGERKVVLAGGSDARYVPTGHLVYAQGNALLAVAFDVDRLQASGGAVSVVEGIQRATNPAVNTAAANYGVSEGGTLAYLSQGAFGVLAAQIATARTFVWVNRQGRDEPLSAPARPYSYPRLSPDGTQIAVDVRDQDSDIWVWSVTRETLTRLTFDPRQDRFPLWSPDGRRIAFSSQRDGSQGNPFWQAADGTGQAERLAEQRNRQVFPTSFSPDGMKMLVYGDVGGSQQDDIGIVSMDGKGGLTPLLQTTFGERNGEVSPDGRWLAYESDESGRLEIYVRPFPGVDGGRWQVSTGGGTQPLWGRNGRELFYRSGEALMAVPIETGSSFVARNPAVVFKGQYAPSFGGRSYDVSPDGRRFLMLKVAASGADTQNTPRTRFIIVENWSEEMKRLVPVN